jgi:hypothetical protein
MDDELDLQDLIDAQNADSLPEDRIGNQSPNMQDSSITMDQGWWNDLVGSNGSSLPTGNGLSGFNLGSLFNALGGGKGIGQLLSGVYGANAANNQSKALSGLAQQALSNADPYLQYRQQAEIPFMLGQMQQYGKVQGQQNTLADLIAAKQGQTNPVVQALQQKIMGTDPLGGDYRNYQNILGQTYSDPMAYYNSSGYQSLANQLGQQLARRDAAKGRLSQYGDRAVEMQNNFLKDIGNYRQGLNQSAQVAGGAQNTAYQNAMSGMAALQNADTQQLGALAGLFNAQTNNLNYLGGLITPRGTAGRGAELASGLGQNSAAYGNYRMNPLLDSAVKMFGG